MKKQNYKYLIRKSHRYLGLFIGVQFIFWTLGGLYFSWTKIESVRGEHLRKKHETINIKAELISPQIVLDSIKRDKKASEISKIQLLEILDVPFYEIKFHADEHAETILANASDGKLRLPISEAEAKKIATDSLINFAEVKNIVYLTKENVGGHHEYREKPLPAWAVTFDNSDNLTVYLSAENGQIGAFRTNEWRIFDFLWMLHTMDFAERDNINNYLLRAFSVLGIVTILSGFLLFFVSSRFFRKLFSAKRKLIT